MPTGQGQTKIVTVWWLDSADDSGDVLSSQQAALHCPDSTAYDDSTQNNWLLYSIDGEVKKGDTPPPISAPSPRSLLKGPLGAIVGGIPWWWLATPSTGTGKFYVSPKSGSSGHYDY